MPDTIPTVAAMAAEQAARFAALAALPPNERPDPAALLAEVRAPVPVPVSPPAPTPEPEAITVAVDASAASPVARIVVSRRVLRTIPLAYPVEFGERVYEAVTLRRPTTAEVADFARLLAADLEGATRHFPVYFDADGAAIPDAVLDALDADDFDAITAEIEDFLPNRLRRMRAPPAPASTPDAGSSTAPTSSTS